MDSGLPDAAGPPRGLRERQKQERERRIVAAASALFAEQGYAATAMEQIAGRAGLAVGTVYNYFDSKPDLLLRVVMRGRERQMAAGAAIVRDPPPEPVEAICRLLLTQVEGATRHAKRLWRVILATATLEPDTFGREYRKTQMQIVEQIEALLSALRARGLLSPAADLHEAAQILFVVVSMAFQRFVADETATTRTVAAELRPKVHLIVEGLRSPALA